MAAAIPEATQPVGHRRPGRPLLALGAGGLVGVVQTLVAQRCGLLQFDDVRSDWWAAELATLTWLSAVSVILGVLVAGRFGRRPESWRGALCTLGAAALGSLLAVPLTTSSVAWAAVYGGTAETSRAALHVVLGIVIGLLAAALAKRYRAMSVGLVIGFAVVWGMALLSAALGGGRTPVLGHPDLGLPDDATAAGQRIAALVVALLCGAVFGACWRTRRAEPRIAAAITGPALVALSYLTVLPVTDQAWPWSPVPTALLMVPCAALAAATASWIAERVSSHRAAR